ncbi:hypothetical protein T484DRAFT_1935242 [Baffinella frigidus]|nr:hypothetical protein T484DRAFT_1935242 [Cryptophyta sp. CCMP2293]
MAGQRRLRDLVADFVKASLQPFLKKKIIDKEIFKGVAKKATDKICDGQLKVDPKGVNPAQTNEMFLNDARRRKMNAVVESYVKLATKARPPGSIGSSWAGAGGNDAPDMPEVDEDLMFSELGVGNDKEDEAEVQPAKKAKKVALSFPTFKT